MLCGAICACRFMRGQTYRAVKKYLKQNKGFDIIFVPTVLVHHLLGWTWLIKKTLGRTPDAHAIVFPQFTDHARCKRRHARLATGADGKTFLPSDSLSKTGSG